MTTPLNLNQAPPYSKCENKGYVVASLGKDSGYVPYTAYSAKQSYINQYPDTIKDLQMLYKKEWTMYSPTLLLKLQK